MRALIAGNWKMNGALADAAARVRALKARLAKAKGRLPEIAVCPPFTLLHPVGKLLAGSAIALGAQDCHAQDKGAYTGSVSAPMLKDLGCRYVIVGHSERRAQHAESDTTVRAKAEAAQRAGLAAIVCVGETREQRAQMLTLAVIEGQLKGSLPRTAAAANTVIAYEPVWAIGTGLVPTAKDIADAHAHLRAGLASLAGGKDKEGSAIRILYGGSATAENAKALWAIPGVDGLLVGGASLDPEAFWTMIAAG